MPAEPQGNFSIELGSAYVAAGVRVASWAIVSAVVWRQLGPESFALLVLVRGTLTLLNYTGFGLAPAMIRLKAKWDQETPPAATVRPAILPVEPGVLDYALPTTRPQWPPQWAPPNPRSVALLLHGSS